jgi:Tfp pilus assembly protein FimT
MAELLMVVAMIGIMAAAASPMFIEMMRDRRVNQTALQTAEMFRQGRARALGRGSAVLVRWTGAANGGGLLEIREAVQSNVDGPLPVSNCTTNSWEDGQIDNRRVSGLDYTQGASGRASLAFVDPIAGPVTAAEVCFTPRGRTFYRTGNGSFAVLEKPPSIEVTNTKTNMLRRVLIAPNGVARLAL